MGGGALGPAFTLAAGAPGEHHVKAVMPLRHHLWHYLGRILQIRIHRDNRQSGGKIQPVIVTADNGTAKITGADVKLKHAGVSQMRFADSLVVLVIMNT